MRLLTETIKRSINSPGSTGLEPDPEFSDQEDRTEEINENIVNEGYTPSPDSNNISESLYRERLTTWLNKQAGIAFVADQTPTTSHVTIKFELPYGGVFTQEFARPDSSYTTKVNYNELLELVDLDTDDLDKLPNREVPIQEVDSSVGGVIGDWQVDTGDDTDTDIEPHPMYGTNGRYWFLAHLLFNRLVLLPTITVAVFWTGVVGIGMNVPSLLTGILLGWLFVMGVVWSLSGRALCHCNSSVYPRWVDK